MTKGGVVSFINVTNPSGLPLATSAPYANLSWTGNLTETLDDGDTLEPQFKVLELPILFNQTQSAHLLQLQ